MNWVTRRKWFLILAAAILLIAIFRPWTVRPIGWEDIAAQSRSPAQSAASIWERRVVGAAYRSITSADELGDTPELVEGEGNIVRLDLSSSVGQAFLDLTPVDGTEDIALQIGPVIRGTTLRDALGLTFSDFASQMEYARVASALNEIALVETRLFPETESVLNARVRFAGAAAGGDAIPRELIPTRLEVVEP